MVYFLMANVNYRQYTDKGAWLLPSDQALVFECGSMHLKQCFCHFKMLMREGTILQHHYMHDIYGN